MAAVSGMSPCRDRVIARPMVAAELCTSAEKVAATIRPRNGWSLSETRRRRKTSLSRRGTIASDITFIAKKMKPKPRTACPTNFRTFRRETKISVKPTPTRSSA